MAAFEALLRELAPDLVAQHSVHEELLAEARRTGISDALGSRVRALVLSMAREPGSLVVCTCSTLGGCAERANEDRPGVAMRIDRPMAERAVVLGQRILIAATLASTLEPTRSLVREVASAAGREIRTSALLCEGAWAHFERGDLEGYHRAIAQALHQGARDADVVILAQASMAPAAALCVELPAPVLSSPRLGIAQALARYRSR